MRLPAVDASAEEVRAHVVVDADDVQPQGAEFSDGLRANQAMSAGYQNGSHCVLLNIGVGTLNPNLYDSALRPDLVVLSCD